MPQSYWLISLCYLLGYVGLDWLSYVEPFAAFGITPWNPSTGLSFALVLLFGTRFVPMLALGPLLADLVVRRLPLPPGIEIAAVIIIAAGYGAACLALVNPRVGMDVTLRSRRDLALMVAVSAGAVLCVAVGYVGLMVFAGRLGAGALWQAVLRFWIGDVIGIMVVTPFLLIVATRPRPGRLYGEAFALLASICVALFLVYSTTGTGRLQLFYLLFLPVIWAAVRFGFEGATSTLLVAQVGLVLTIQLAGHRAFDLATYQTAMIVLSLTGLSVGMLVSEQQAAEQQLRQHQDALARSARASSMGEFAAAIAHEINQPLAAIGNYARAIDRAARAEPIESATVREAAGKAVEQVDRAAEVVRRLRELIQSGRIVLKQHAVERIVSESVALSEADFQRHGILLDVSIEPGVPDVAVDRLQIEQVVVNLLRNALEALFEAGRSDGKVVLSATSGADDMITISIEDNGPGFASTEGIRDKAVLEFDQDGWYGPWSGAQSLNRGGPRRQADHPRAARRRTGVVHGQDVPGRANGGGMTIALIDDDPAVLDSLQMVLRGHGLKVLCFASAEAFMASPDKSGVECIVSDVRMPGMTGLDLQRALASQDSPPPLILVTGHGDIAMAVQAIKDGAVDFVEKPFDDQRLVESIAKATATGSRLKSQRAAQADIAARMAELSERQRQVMNLVVEGLSNKEIAQRLGISPRTVENYRAWVMEKMDAGNLAELVRKVMMTKREAG